MKKHIILLSTLILSLFASAQELGRCPGDNTKPMFGYEENHKENECDKSFLETVLTQSKGDKRLAYQGVIKIAWDTLGNQKDPATAIKRFNQAWLIDRSDFEVYWGFGIWELMRGEMEKSLNFLQMAYKKNNKSPGLIADYAHVMSTIAIPKKDQNQIKQAEDLLKQAKSLDKNETRPNKVLLNLYLSTEQYSKAWEEIKVLEKIDPKSVPPQVITDLEKKMPRPK